MAHRTSAVELSRRGFLRGLGTCIALPALESVAPSVASAAGQIATTESGAPLRMAFLYSPNGRVMKNWTPAGD
ncbi:MAG: hypothetical protein ACI9R3_004179, partial [Verrucomicrobiales bacterium]